MIDSRLVLLTLCDYYLPGYKAGGPIRTIAGMVEHLASDFVLKIVTRDRDLGETEPYPELTAGAWHPLGAAKVMYLSPTELAGAVLRSLIYSTEHDVLYLNSCFSIPFGIVPLLLRRFRLIPRRPLVIAPRGELARGALAIKSGRKHMYLTMAMWLGLTREVTWQASGPHEADDVRRSFGPRARIVVAPDLAVAMHHGRRRVEKQPGHLRLLFVSRISRKKNLETALTILEGVTGSIHFSIYGPLEDVGYWHRCQQLVALLPPNIKAEYGGVVPPDRIASLMAQHDMLFLPTRGENFGHVILEAMASGCPVLISDRTWWRGLEATGVGWDIPLEEPEKFRDVLDRCVAMDSDAWRVLAERASRYSSGFLRDPHAREQNRLLFRAVHGAQLGRSQHLSQDG